MHHKKPPIMGQEAQQGISTPGRQLISVFACILIVLWWYAEAWGGSAGGAG